MNQLQVFNNTEFGQVRTMTIDGSPWFVAKDVCECLGLTNPTMSVGQLDEDERAKFNLGRQGNTNIINEFGQNRLFNWLRENGYLICRKGTDYNMPTQRSMEMQLFNIKETAITHSDGHVSISKTVKVTGKGQVYFVNKFLKGA